jgi:hypothetical protein
MAAHKIVHISHEEDVFAADETKVHTLSRQAISEMLDTAERREVLSSAPPPASGVRPQAAESPRAAVTKSGTMQRVAMPAAPPDALPVTWSDEDEDLEPTRLSERSLLARQEIPRPELPRPQLVTQLINEPPVIICPPPMTTAVQPDDRRALDRRALAIMIASFVVTLVPGLVLLHHLLSR